jgi:hypothetical protein
VKFYEFLKKEYQRILESGVLSASIQAFRQRFEGKNHTDEKIIDSLIWKFVDGVLNRSDWPDRSAFYA